MQFKYFQYYFSLKKLFVYFILGLVLEESCQAIFMKFLSLNPNITEIRIKYHNQYALDDEFLPVAILSIENNTHLKKLAISADSIFKEPIIAALSLLKNMNNISLQSIELDIQETKSQNPFGPSGTLAQYSVKKWLNNPFLFPTDNNSATEPFGLSFDAKILSVHSEEELKSKWPAPPNFIAMEKYFHEQHQKTSKSLAPFSRSNISNSLTKDNVEIISYLEKGDWNKGLQLLEN